tara:strand:+ start:572 stop:1018 length:447 start_codon:yes stop_codon:yes gene_type:complete
MKKIEVRIIPSSLTYTIRNKVLWPHKEFKNCKLSIDDLVSTYHIGSFFEEDLISVGTFLKEKNTNFDGQINQYRLRAMGTLQNFQGLSGGKSLLLYAIKFFKKKQINLIWCDARINAIPFYQKIGMKTKGDFYDIPLIGKHKLMYIYL